jgi:hopene-associated glycosyltransferase HpnB
LLVWIVLLVARGDFWRSDQMLEDGQVVGRDCPPVIVVIPARDEAETIGDTVSSLLSQNYPGRLSVIVVDDNSRDGTAAAAIEAANGDPRLRVISGQPLEAGWTGKLWAVSQGVEAANAQMPADGFLWLTDADIVHDPDNLQHLMAKALNEKRDLVSLMVRLHCETVWEKLLIPAFVFFFQKLFPFPWVNDPAKPTAAAAGGCMLVRRHALEAIGGIAAIKGQLIDDCALAAAIKKTGGKIWLGLTDRTVSLRRYDRLSEVGQMVARTAYEQLDNSPLWLLGTLVGMTILYVVPPIAFVVGIFTGNPWTLIAGLSAVIGMTFAYWPTVRLYKLAAYWGLALPPAAFLYTLFTLESARRTWKGEGGAWKGRSYRNGASGRG